MTYSYRKIIGCGECGALLEEHCKEDCKYWLESGKEVEDFYTEINNKLIQFFSEYKSSLELYEACSVYTPEFVDPDRLDEMYKQNTGIAIFFNSKKQMESFPKLKDQKYKNIPLYFVLLPPKEEN